MTDLYLWDRSGPPDHEVERLEHLLSRYRYTPRAMPVTARRSRTWIWAAAACLVIATLTLGYRAYQRFLSNTSDVIATRGQVNVNTRAISGTQRLYPGDHVEVASAAEACVRVGSIGSMILASRSLLQLTRFDSRQHRYVLSRGSLRASVIGAPYRFVIDTPFATAYDLGCTYALDVDPDGNGRLYVTSGWVSLQNSETESLVGEGTAAEMRRGLAPGVPFRPGAPEAVRAAVADISFGHDASALATALAGASKDDAVMLMNLLWRVDERERGAVFDRLAALFPPPAGVTREAIVAGNWSVIRRWWTGLGFGAEKKLPRRFYVE